MQKGALILSKIYIQNIPQCYAMHIIISSYAWITNCEIKIGRDRALAPNKFHRIIKSSLFQLSNWLMQKLIKTRVNCGVCHTIFRQDHYMLGYWADWSTPAPLSFWKINLIHQMAKWLFWGWKYCWHFNVFTQISNIVIWQSFCGFQ